MRDGRITKKKEKMKETAAKKYTERIKNSLNGLVSFVYLYEIRWAHKKTNGEIPAYITKTEMVYLSSQ